MPNILWIIQGEEEVGSAQAHKIMPQLFQNIKASLFLEETGYHRNEQPLLLYQRGTSVSTKTSSHVTSSLNNALYSGTAKIENRTLSKFGECPFVSNLPPHSHYISFGPNDYNAKIHQSNESMDEALLMDYYENTFPRFLNWFEQYSQEAIN